MNIFIVISLVLIIIGLYDISRQIRHLHIFLYDWKEEMQGKNLIDDLDDIDTY